MRQLTHIVMNIETGAFYSESPQLKHEAKRLGMKWNSTSILPKFAKQFTRYKDALKYSQKLSNKTGSVCSVMSFLSCPIDTDKIIAEYQEHFLTMGGITPNRRPILITVMRDEGIWAH